MDVKPGYKQTEVGVIPEQWDAGGLSRFWTVTDCKHVTAEFVANGFAIASIKEVQSRFVDLTNAKQTTNPFYNLLIEGGRKPCPGDLILSRNATVGEVSQVAEWHPPFAMGQDVCLLRKKSPDYSTEFLQAVFQSPVIANQLSDLMVGSTFKRVNVKQIRNFSVPMPSPPEQHAIASALSDVDALIGAMDQIIAKKRDLKQAAMQQLLTGKKRLPHFHGDWEVKQLGDIAQLKNGYSFKSETYNPVGDFKIVTIANVQDGYMDTAECSRITEIPPDVQLHQKLKLHDILISMTGNVGRVCRVNDTGCLLNQRVGKLLAIGCDDGLLFMLLSQRQFLSAMATKAKGGAQGNLSVSDIMEFQFSVPPTDSEQTAIAEVLSDMDAEIAALEQRRDKTRVLKQGMMQELLTGRTRLI